MKLYPLKKVRILSINVALIKQATKIRTKMKNNISQGGQNHFYKLKYLTKEK